MKTRFFIAVCIIVFAMIIGSSGIVAAAGKEVIRYAGSDGIVQRSEAVQAVMDYFDGTITRQEAVAVMAEYFEPLPIAVPALLSISAGASTARIVTGDEASDFGGLVEEGSIVVWRDFSIQNTGTEAATVTSVTVAKNMVASVAPIAFEGLTVVGYGAEWENTSSLITFVQQVIIPAGQNITITVSVIAVGGVGDPAALNLEPIDVSGYVVVTTSS